MNDRFVIQWYYSKMGLKQGPVPDEELRLKIRRGEIGETTLVWRDGMADWLPLSQVSELDADRSSVDTNSQGISPEEVKVDVVLPPPMSAPGNIQIEQPVAFQGNYVAPNIPSYLVPSIVGTVLSAISMMIFCLAPGIITGVVAMVYASKVDGLKVQGAVMEATAASKTAKVWMIVTYVLLALPVLAGIALVIFAGISNARVP